MQIKPFAPSFNGYVEVSARRYKPYSSQSETTTFNTNSIVITEPPYSESENGDNTYIASSGEAYIASCPYPVMQKACLLADQKKDAIVHINQYNKISITEIKTDQTNQEE